jgi:hypothetical protein
MIAELRARAWMIGCLFCLALLCVQTIRIEGLKIWPLNIHGLKADLKDAMDRLDKIDRDARKAQAAGKQISKDIRGKTDEENRRIAGDADAVRVSGPGKAVCRPAPAAPGGHDKASGKPDAPGPQVPPADSAAVPWPWLVQRAEQADLNRAEVLAWREWYDKLVASWPKQ